MHYKKGMILKSIPAVLGAFLASAILEFTLVFGNVFYLFDGLDYTLEEWLHTAYPLTSSTRLVVLFLCFSVFFIALTFKGKTIWDFVYKYRYIFAVSLLVVCVVFSVSGSSIGCWKYMINQSDHLDINDGVIFGTSRLIRGDEWAANTPMAFSQQFEQFPYFGNIVRGDTTDMFIVYGQPVIHLVEIFRPFHWGYLILGIDKGLSFFWCARLIALFMVSFEFSTIFFKKSRSFAVMFAVLVSFAPVVQWWFAINGFVEMLIFGMLTVICVHFYMNTKNYIKRILIAFIVFICGGGYILTFYPAWQVPLGYVFLALVISTVIKSRKNFIFTKKDIPIMLAFVIALAGSMGVVFINSKETVDAVMNTAYPGQRVGIGGDGKGLFEYFTNLTLPTDANGLPADKNQCEMALFFDFFPLGIIVAVYAMIKQKRADALLICLLSVEAFLLLYHFVGWNESVAKITLMGFSATGRSIVALSFANLLLLFRSVSLSKYKMHTAVAIVIAIVVTVFVAFMCRNSYHDYMHRINLLLAAAFFCVATFLILKSDIPKINTVASVFISVVILFSGILINPIRTGVDCIYDNTLTNEISEVAEEDNHQGKWIFDSASYPLINLPIMAGAPSITSTNVYPDMERWQKLDPNGEYEEIYNRYAHVSVSLNENAEEKTTFCLQNPDVFLVKLNVNDLQTLDVSYLISHRDLEALSNDHVQISKLKNADDKFSIFKVDYK